MNVAYLDPAYSRHFHDLAASVASRSGGRSVALLSSPAYRQYTQGDRSFVWPPGRSARRYDWPAEFERAEWAALRDPDAAAVFSHAVEWFIERFTQERIELCLIFSDARPFSVAARLAAQELGVVCLYFERGAFRFATSSLSTHGLNARFSLDRARTSGGIDGMPANASLLRRPTEPWLRTRFAMFLARNALARLGSPERDLIQHKRYSLRRYLRLAWSQFQTEHHHRRADTEEVDDFAGRPLVIVPLQLPSDSQFVLYSPFATNQALIDFVAEQVRAEAPDAVLLFKRHPMDASHDHLPAGARWVGGNLARFDKARPIVVCINSTVGFESLVRGMRVICFGPSFYADNAMLVRATKASFGDDLRRALARDVDPAAGDRLRADVLRWCQAPGDAWAYTPADIEATAGIVLQHLHAAREQRNGASQ